MHRPNGFDFASRVILEQASSFEILRFRIPAAVILERSEGFRWDAPLENDAKDDAP